MLHPIETPQDGIALGGRDAGSGIADLYANASAVIETVPICNQFTIQGDLFSKAVLENTEVPNPLEEAFCNMAVIDAVFRSAETGTWEVPERL